MKDADEERRSETADDPADNQFPKMEIRETGERNHPRKNILVQELDMKRQQSPPTRRTICENGCHSCVRGNKISFWGTLCVDDNETYNERV